MIPCPDATCDCDLQGTERLLPDLAAFATGLLQTAIGAPNCRPPLARKSRASMIKTNHPVDGCQPVRDSSVVPRIGDQSSSPSSEHDHGCRR